MIFSQDFDRRYSIVLWMRSMHTQVDADGMMEEDVRQLSNNRRAAVISLLTATYLALQFFVLV